MRKKPPFASYKKEQAKSRRKLREMRRCEPGTASFESTEQNGEKQSQDADPATCPNCKAMKRALVRQARAFAPKGAGDNLLNEKEVATYLDCSIQYVRKLRYSGDGPFFVSKGRWIRYRPMDVRRYVLQNRRQSTSGQDDPKGLF